LSVIDPELFYTVPKAQIANGIADMMSHIFERYFTYTSNTDFTDKLCEATLKVLIENGPKVFADPSSYDAWCEVSLAGNMAQNGQLGVGRIPDWASHMLEHELSAIYDVAHGAGLSILMPAWMTHVYKENIGIFLQFAVNVMGVPLNHNAPDETIREGIARLKAFFKSLGLPVTLEELDIDDSNFELMAKRASGEEFGKAFRLGGVKKMGTEDALAIFRIAAE
jgi:alcohol dehydrogenase YqhD (iron-dependent ADH family)